MVFAILLGNIFAPAIDYAVMWANIRRRARRHAR
jgi:Na+-translocating ferredoxin:NAD+ oxidoreductase RnfD subunit